MSVLETAIGWLAPPQCVGCGEEGRAVCSSCTTAYIQPFGERCWRCNAVSTGGRTCPKCRVNGSPTHVWIHTDHQGVARDLLRIYKFGHQRAAAEPIAQLMVNTLLLLTDPARPCDYLVVPISTATSRIRERSFGHSELLARKIALKLRADQANALRRLGQVRQLGAKRPDRLIQLDGSFVVKDARKVRGRNILLVDDVVTTGGTLMAATKVLRAAGAHRVDALLFAKRL